MLEDDFRLEFTTGMLKWQQSRAKQSELCVQHSLAPTHMQYKQEATK